MKKIFLISLLFLICSKSSLTQTAILSASFDIRANRLITDGFNVGNRSLSYHNFTWTTQQIGAITPVFSACTLLIQSSGDNVNWTTQNTQSCIANGNTGYLNFTPNYIRINASAFTLSSGNAFITISYAAYVTNPTNNPATLTPTTLNNKQYCHLYTGVSASVQITNCANALPSTGGIADDTGRQGAQNWTTDAFNGITFPIDFVTGATTYTVSATSTIPNNVRLFPRDSGCIFSVNSGITLNVNGPIQATPSQQIFCGTTGPDGIGGYVTIGTGGTTFVTPQWFGAKQDGATNDYNALMSAIYASQTSQHILTVQLLESATPYITGNALELPKYTHLRGAKSNGSIIKAGASFPDTNILQNWRRVQNSSDTAPATTTGLGFPSQILFLENFQIDTNNQAINALNLVHLQEGTFLRDLVIQGNRVASLGNANVRDGIRVYTNSDAGTSTQTWGLTNIVFYGQFRRCIDINTASWLWFDKINCTGSTQDDIRVTNGSDEISMSNLELLDPQTTDGDNVGNAGLNISDVSHFVGSGITVASSGSSNFTNRVGLLINDSVGFPGNRNYFITNYRTTYGGAGTARFAFDFQDKTLTPNRNLTDQSYPFLTKGMFQGHTGSALSNLQIPNNYVTYSRTFLDNIQQSYTFNAGDFTASSGTWTVIAGNILNLNYSLTGKWMTIDFDIANTTASGGQSYLKFTIPGGYTVATGTRIQTPITCSDNGAVDAVCSADINGGDTFLRFERGVRGGAGNWSASSSNTRVTGQVSFWIN